MRTRTTYQTTPTPTKDRHRSWTTGDGRTTSPAEMSGAHLRNAILWLQEYRATEMSPGVFRIHTKAPTKDGVRLGAWIETFRQELALRGLKE